MQLMVALIKGQAGIHVFSQQSHDFRLQRAPRRAKLRQPRFGFRTTWRFKDRVRFGTELLAAQPAGGLVGERFLRERIGRGQLAVAERPFEPTDFMDDTALLFGVRQEGRERGGQAGTAIADHQLHRIGIQPTRDQRGQQSRPGRRVFGRSQLIVDDLMSAIFPDAHNRQDDLILTTHLASLVATLVEKGRTSRKEHLAPHTIDNQDWRRIRDRAGTPAFHG